MALHTRSVPETYACHGHTPLSQRCVKGRLSGSPPGPAGILPAGLAPQATMSGVTNYLRQVRLPASVKVPLPPAVSGRNCQATLVGCNVSLRTPKVVLSRTTLLVAVELKFP